jgi:hypothetical protein
METIEYLFREVGNFHQMFLEESELLTLDKKDFFVRENEICNFIGIVEQGSLISYFENENTEKRINGIYTTKSIVTSYRSFLTQTPSDGFIQAFTKTNIRIISYEKYLILQGNKEWLTFFKTIGDELFIKKCKKETSLILLTARERYNQLIKKNPFIEQAFSQHIIASYLNIRPETLSRLKSLDLHQH